VEASVEPPADSDQPTPVVETQPAGGEPAAELEQLRRELAAARAQADQHLASWQRSAADFANFKRRVDDDKQYVERWLLQDLLPLADEFERAWAALPRELRNLSWIEGVWQVHQKLRQVLERHGVTAIEAEGKPFDPLEHEAVLREEGLDPAVQAKVVVELQRGYRLHGRVLRAALVKVGPGDEV
jgi:molecular chaperone GrpE